MAITEPALQQAYVQRALAAGVPQAYIDSFLAGNEDDYHRLETTWDAYGRDQWAQGADGQWGLTDAAKAEAATITPEYIAALRAKGYGGQPTQYEAIDPRTVKGVDLGALGGDSATMFGIDNSPTGDSGIKPGFTNHRNSASKPTVPASSFGNPRPTSYRYGEPVREGQTAYAGYSQVEPIDYRRAYGQGAPTVQLSPYGQQNPYVRASAFGRGQ